jgi:hypothetical protein
MMRTEKKRPSLIDTSYNTMQQDLFASGIAASIGGNAFMLWNAIKTHADTETGVCWPGIRRLAEMTGTSVGSIHRYIEILEANKLLRVTRGERGKGNVYVARERMDVRVGSRVLCTIVIDYVPDKMGEKVQEIKEAVNGKTSPEAFADCEIIPGDGFQWDPSAGVLRAAIPTTDIKKQGFLGFPQAENAPGLLLKDS